MPEPEVYHIPALLPQSLDALDLHQGGIYVDLTLGGGGHSRAILSHIGADGRLIAFDRDSEAIDRAVADPQLGGDSRFTPVLANFRFLTNFLRYHGIAPGTVDGILGDLGVSFHHFDDPARGFSFRFDSPLDMRMNRRAPVTAATLLDNVTPERLTEILSLYGELKNARRVTDAIVAARTAKPIETAGQLVETVKPLLNPRRQTKELACIFQALRIEVNDELGALRRLLDASLRALKPGGRLAIITYHSLEYRLVKNFMRAGNLEGRVEQDFYGRIISPLKPLGGKPITPDDEEVARNPRSRSAKLRVAVKSTDPSQQ